jgi:hypothetical protein
MPLFETPLTQALTIDVTSKRMNTQRPSATKIGSPSSFKEEKVTLGVVCSLQFPLMASRLNGPAFDTCEVNTVSVATVTLEVVVPGGRELKSNLNMATCAESTKREALEPAFETLCFKPT